MTVRPDAHLLLSLHPEHCHRILSGEKTVEYRKTRPTRPGRLEVFLYETHPTCALTGKATIQEVIDGTPEEVWRATSHTRSTSRERFFRYFRGRPRAVGLVLVDTQRLERPVPLAELASKMPGFRPPQTFMYVDETTIERAISARPS